MIQHFKFKPLFENTALPGWHISFYHDRVYYEGAYKADGTIECIVPKDEQFTDQIKKDIHGLMSFHVYD